MAISCFFFATSRDFLPKCSHLCYLSSLVMDGAGGKFSYPSINISPASSTYLQHFRTPCHTALDTTFCSLENARCLCHNRVMYSQNAISGHFPSHASSMEAFVLQIIFLLLLQNNVNKALVEKYIIFICRSLSFIEHTDQNGSLSSGFVDFWLMFQGSYS